MQYLQFTAARADTGAVLPFAKATVYAAGTTTKAALFNASGSSIANPVTADLIGLVSFAAADALYDIAVTSADGSYSVPPLKNVQMVDLLAIRGTITSGRLAYPSWSALAANTSAAAGQVAEVTVADTGTHTDLVVGGTVSNTGIYRWSASPAGWQRIYDIEAAATIAAAVAAVEVLPFTVTSASGQTVTTRGLLAGVSSPANGQTAYLAEAGREGWFKFSTANLSAKVTIDTAQGRYVAPSAAPTGASGAWVRIGDLKPAMFGTGFRAAQNIAAADGLTVPFLGAVTTVPQAGVY